VSPKDIDPALVIAPLPESLQERGIAAPGLLAQILVGNYCDHLPRRTLARWVALAADWLNPVYGQYQTADDFHRQTSLAEATR